MSRVLKLARFIAVCLAAAALAAPPVAALDPPGSVALDWPMGQILGGQLYPGYGITVLQNFANSNPSYSGRQHAAMDLALDAGSANGASVAVGQAVNRGSYLGTVTYYPLNGGDNSHLHFEVRSFKNWPATGQCWGPGYALSGHTPQQDGWLNPVQEYFNRR